MKKNIIIILTSILQFLIIVAIIYLFNLDIDINNPLILLLLLIGGLVVSIYLNVITHELGHLLFGAITGYQFVSFQIFSHLWYRDVDGKIKHKRTIQAGILGQALMKYPHEYRDDMPYFWYNAGGVIVNILLSVIAIILLYFNFNIFINVFLLLFLYISITFVFANGIPHKDSFNDARNIYSIYKSKRIKKAFYDQTSLSYQLITTSIENIDIDTYLHDDLTVGMVVSNNIINYYKALACTEYDQAYEIITTLYNNIDQIITPLQALIYSEYMTMALLYENDLAKVTSILSSLKKPIKTAIFTVEDSPFLRVAYIYYKFINYDEKKKQKAQEGAYQSIKKSHQLGLNELLLKLLEAVINYNQEEGTVSA